MSRKFQFFLILVVIFAIIITVSAGQVSEQQNNSSVSQHNSTAIPVYSNESLSVPVPDSGTIKSPNNTTGNPTVPNISSSHPGQPIVEPPGNISNNQPDTNSNQSATVPLPTQPPAEPPSNRTSSQSDTNSSIPISLSEQSISNSLIGNQSDGIESPVLEMQFVTEQEEIKNTSKEKDEKDNKKCAEFAEDEVIVRFNLKPGKEMDSASADKSHKAVGATIKKDFDKKGLAGTQVVKIPPGLSVEKAIAKYKEDPNVLSAEPNYRIDLMYLPDDPDFPLQWGLLNTGETGGVLLADIHAVSAWNISTGDPAFTVSFAGNDVPGIWTFTFTDAVTGLSAIAKVELKKN